MLASQLRVSSVPVAGIEAHMYRGGDGPPLLLLHGMGGNPCGLAFQQSLAQHFTLYAPSHPGFGLTPRAEWIERICDVSMFYLWMLRELNLDRVHVLGHGVGGWIAADMATVCPQAVDRLVLVSPMGVKPERAEIRDLFLMTHDEVLAASYYRPRQVPEWDRLHGSERSPQDLEHAETALEMLVRLCWKPYMHDRRLPYLLPRIERPCLIVCGRHDAILPLECGERYQQGIAGARLVVFDACGHFPQLEHPQAFADTVRRFLQ